jgi:hypothetical protein
MDPVSVAGTAIGAVSLSIQILDGIFKSIVHCNLYF